MDKKDIGFGSYKLGVASDLKQPAFIGLDQAINWGAPSVEVQGEMGRIGKSGVEALKNLAAANKVDVSWHVPPAENFELAIPDKKMNQRAMKGIEVGIEHAAKAGMKLITIHPTQVIPRTPEDQMYIFDKESGKLSPAHVPKDKHGRYNKERYMKLLDQQKRNEIEERIVWSDRYMADAEKVVELGEPIARIIDSKKSLKHAIRTSPAYAERYLALIGRGGEALKEIRKGNEKFLDDITSDRYVQAFKNKYNREKQFYKVQKDRKEILQEMHQHGLKEGFIEDGRRVINQNLINNMSKLAKKAIDNGITFALENTDERFMYSTPEELNQVVSGIKQRLKSMGVPKSKINKHVGVTFDMGHAATVQDLEVVDEKTGKTVRIGPPSEFMKKIKHDIKEVHAVESFGDVDSHLPLGEAFSDEERKKMEEYLKKHAQDPRVISEGVAQGSTGPGFAYGMQNITGLYSVAGTPTNMMWGPTYMSSSFDEGLFMPGDKREHYFYSSFTGGLF